METKKEEKKQRPFLIRWLEVANDEVEDQVGGDWAKSGDIGDRVAKYRKSIKGDIIATVFWRYHRTKIDIGARVAKYRKNIKGDIIGKSIAEISPYKD